MVAGAPQLSGTPIEHPYMLVLRVPIILTYFPLGSTKIGNNTNIIKCQYHQIHRNIYHLPISLYHQSPPRPTNILKFGVETTNKTVSTINQHFGPQSSTINSTLINWWLEFLYRRARRVFHQWVVFSRIAWSLHVHYVHDWSYNHVFQMMVSENGGTPKHAGLLL